MFQIGDKIFLKTTNKEGIIKDVIYHPELMMNVTYIVESDGLIYRCSFLDLLLIQKGE